MSDDALEYKDASIQGLFNKPSEAALAYFRDKGLKPTFDWRDMLAEEHDAAFTVAKMADVDLLADTKELLDQAITQGWGKDQFRRELTPHLQAKGWWGQADLTDPLTGATTRAQLGSAHRLNTIYRTNARSAYSVGHWQKIQANREQAPYLLYDAVDDHRTRRTHAAWDGTVLPVDSDFWDTHYPPNGFNCRCGVIQLTSNELSEYDLEPAKRPPPANAQTWTNPRTGETRQVPAGVDPGFDRNPGHDRIDHLRELYGEKVASLPPEWQTALGEPLSAQLKRAARQHQQAQAASAAAAAQAEIDQALDDNTPHLAPAIKKLQAQKQAADWTPDELLAKAKAKAEASKKNQALNSYKESVLAGKEPTDTAKSYFADLTPDEQAQINAQIAAKAANQAADADLKAIASGDAPNKKVADAYAKLDAAGELDGLKPAEALAKVDALAQELKDKANQASLANAYKQNAIKGKTPTEKQAAAFQALDDAKKQKLLDEIDAAQAEAKADKQWQAIAAHAEGKPDGVPSKEALKHTLSEAGDAPASVKLETFKAKVAQLQQQQQNAPPAPATGAADPEPEAPAPPATGATDLADPPDPSDLVQVGARAGSNPGGVYQEQATGRRYYVKMPQSEDIARNEVLAAKLYEAAGVDAPEVHLLDMDGQPAVASRMVDDLTEPGRTADWSQYDGAHRGLPVDAWLANWDVVGLDFDNLKANGKRAFRVDTGGALRYRAQGGQKGAAWSDTVTELDTLRDPNMNPQAAQVFGGVTRDDLIAGARQVLSVDDATIRRMVDDYGPTDAAERAALVDRLIARKANIAEQIPEALEPRTPAAPAPGTDAPVTPAEVRTIADARANGYALHTDKGQIEDQQVLVNHYTGSDGQPYTRAWFKVRADAAKKLASGVDIGAARDATHTAIKGIATRAATGWEPKDRDRLDDALEVVRQSLDEIDAANITGKIDSGDSFKYAAQLQSWRNELEKLDSRVRVNGTGDPPSQLDLDVPDEIPGVATESGGLTWQKIPPVYERMKLRRGNAIATGIDAEYTGVDDIYETTLPNGTRVRHITDNSNNALTARGQVIIDTPGDDQGAAARALATLDDLGVDNTRSTTDDARELYLHRLLYIQTTRDKAAQARWQQASASGEQPERIAAMTDLANELAGRDVTRSPEWRQIAEREAFGHGRFRQNRPDLDPAEYQEFADNHVLFHNPTGLSPEGARGSGAVLERLMPVVDGGGSFASLMDRTRRGIPIDGTSAAEDFSTGGANYFFARIQPRNTRGQRAGVVLKTDTIKRMDAISYLDDEFGNTKPEVVQKNRRTTPSEWAQAARQNASNELIFRDTVSLFDAVDTIVFYDRAEYLEAVDFFSDRGYTEWPDGRALQDVLTYIGAKQ